MFWKKKDKTSQPPPLPKKEPMRTGTGHPGTFNEPKNPLEEALVAFRARQIEGSQFFEKLFNSDIYILPLEEDIGESSREAGAPALSKSPTLFCMNYPEYSALGLYTAPERATPTCKLHPEFKYAIAVQAGDFLLGLKGDFGIVINPYLDVNVEWSNEQFRSIIGMVKKDV